MDMPHDQLLTSFKRSKLKKAIIIFVVDVGTGISKRNYGGLCQHEQWRRKKNKDFKYQYLHKFKDKSLSGMITVLVEQFSVRKYER